MADRSLLTVLELLQSTPVVEFGEVQAALGGAARSTTFRYLEQVPYRSSYNHNGRYYALHSPSKYDRWGLRSVGDIHFSIDGTLKATVIRLVHESEAGCTQRELQDILRVRVQVFLLAALREGSVNREKVGGPFVYLHTNPEVREAQVSRREEQIAATPSNVEEGEQVGHEVTIRVLLVMLRHLGSKAGDVVRHLKGRSPPVSRAQVDHVFARYGLGEKGGPQIY